MGKYLDLDKYQVFFFGSRVAGRSSERADIDIGIKGPRKVPIGVMAKIRDDIFNLPTLYSIDVVDFQSAQKNFRQVAEKYVEPIG